MQQVLLCEEETKTERQLLLRCKFTSQIWTVILNIYGVHLVMPGSGKQALATLQGCKMSKEIRRKLWNTTPLCIFFG